jgi:hypothetical protein
MENRSSLIIGGIKCSLNKKIRYCKIGEDVGAKRNNFRSTIV